MRAAQAEIAGGEGQEPHPEDMIPPEEGKAEPTLSVRATFPAGSYYIGDPCHMRMFHGAAWDDFMGWFGGTEKAGKYRGRNVAVGFTAHGDGLYDGSDGEAYPVDAGVIAIVQSADEATHEFGGPFKVELGYGVFSFGGVHIDTAADPDAEDGPEDASLN